ncbi:hypothetical protein AJ80_09935 [Polytolypa hystricis UAMH7299]|uniref:Uncharacterized protein n=1 Tax=Polytolypa hystricis (strain UAMH7299) TaxID=1447883 RepID=A0A2B7WG01_POLH7|nr:hypothetical protein AJ80_09935 [Polytolypa hystricis UAMH7299]
MRQHKRTHRMSIRALVCNNEASKQTGSTTTPHSHYHDRSQVMEKATIKDPEFSTSRRPAGGSTTKVGHSSVSLQHGHDIVMSASFSAKSILDWGSERTAD